MIKLLNVIQDLKNISDKIGVTTTIIPEFKPVLITGTIKEMIKSGKIQKVNNDEILRTTRGEILFLYIPDNSYLLRPTYSGEMIPDTPYNRNKVHLCYCETLQKMESVGRGYRYIATNQHTGKFPIKYSDTKESITELNVCRHCIKLINNSFGKYNEFNFKKFYQDFNYAVPWFESRAKILYGVDYPPNWREISYLIRKNRGWKCEKCGRDCSKTQYMLDLHHKNGIKSDCSERNLMALCRDCHRKEPNHSHMNGVFRIG